MRGRILQEEGDVQLDVEVTDNLPTDVERCVLVACGTAWHACLVGKFLIESLAGIPCEVDYGSEFRYRDPILDPKTLLLVVSQSGETADTLAAVETGREKRHAGARGVQRGGLVDRAPRRAACSTPTPGRRSASPARRRSPPS